MIAWLVETLVVTTGLMALVLVARDPVRRLFGSHAAYALWLLPALRMILPPLGAFLPESRLFNGVAQTSHAVDKLVRSEIVVQIVTGTGQAGAATAIAPVEAFNWPLLLAALWVIGLLAFAVHQCLAYRRFCSFILSEATLRDQIAPGVLLVSSPRARGPMAFGLRHRFVVLPEDADCRFDEEERAMALAHELAHHARGDLIANAFALVILTLHWCNPVAWIAYRAFRTDQEMACDADVIDAVRGSHLGHAYGRALVKSASGHEFAAACNLTTVDRLKRRLAMLSNKSPSNRRRKAGILLAGAVVLSGLSLTASGESMAAQVGARVSDALPRIPRMQDVLPSLPAVAPVPAAPPMHAADADKPRKERHIQKTIIITDGDDDAAFPVPPVPPAPPAPPAPGVAPTPPVPPLPPLPPVADADGKHSHQVIRRIYRDGHQVTEEMLPLELAGMQRIEMTESCDGKDPVSRTEENVTRDGKTQKIVKVRICKRQIAEQVRAAKDQHRLAFVEMRTAQGDALNHLRETRDELARNRDLSEETRAEVLADIDRSIARLEAQKSKDK